MTSLKPLFSSATIGLLLAAAFQTLGCDRCQCPEPQVLSLSDGLFDFTTIRITDHYDGGDSDEWQWEDAESPWGEVTEAQIRVEGGNMTVEYRTEDGRFRLEAE